MTKDNHHTSRKSIRSRRLWRKLSPFFKKKVLRLLPWLIGIWFIIWAAGMFFVRPIAKARISKLCNNSAVYIESGRFKGLAGIRLKGVAIAENDTGLVKVPIFQFDEIDIGFDPWKLLRGKFEIHSIRLSDFLFNATYDTQEQWNFLPLLGQHKTSTSAKIPLIEIRNGAMRVSRMQDDQRKTITTVSLNGQAAVQTGKREYSFSLMTDGRFGYGDSALSGSLTIGSPGQKSRFAAAGRLQMPKTKVFENAWDLDDIRFECEFDHQELILKRCGFSMGDGTVDVRGSIQNDEQDRKELNLDLKLHSLELSDHYKRNAIVYSESVLELLDPGLRRFLERYHPNGLGDMELSFLGHLDDLSETLVNGTIVCGDISVRDKRFPYLLENMQGTIVLSGRDLKLSQLQAHHGSVDLLIDGSILNLGPSAKIDLQVTSPNVEFNEDLYKALNDSVKKVWYSFSPKGRTTIDYHFQRFEDGGRDQTLILNLKDTGIVYEHFPYPLENMTGRVAVNADSVELEQIISHYEDGRVVTLNGQILDIKNLHPNFQIHVHAEQIPVEDKLINAMPPSQREFIKELDLRAVAEVDVDVFSSAVGERPWDYIAKINVDGEHLKYTEFPLPISDVHLTADVTHEVVRLHHFEGATAGGRIAMSGTLLPKGMQPEEPGLCVDLELKNFDFNDVFWDAAENKFDNLLGNLRPRGRMDVNGHLAINLPESICSVTDLAIECNDNPVFWADKFLGQASGNLHMTNKAVLFKDFHLNKCRLESVPEELLAERLKDIYSGLKPEGETDVQIDEGLLRMGEDGPEQIDVKGGVVFKDVAIGPGKRVHGIDGDVYGRLEYDRAADTWRTLMLCDIDHFNYHNWLVSDFYGNFVYDPNTKDFEATDISAGFYGGSIIGDIEVDFSPEDKVGYRLGFSVNEVDVPQFLAADNQDVMERVKQGKACGSLTLAGDLQSPEQSTGKAMVEVVNMKMGRQSVLGKILTAIQFKMPEEYVFSEFKAQTVIRESQLIIEDIRIVGKPLVFRGQGSVDLKEKQIAVDLVAYDRLIGNEDTIFDSLARGIGSAVWKIEVRGDLNNPNVDAVFLSVLKQPLNLFEKKE